MLPREKLIQCFLCENNLECWGLIEDIPLGINSRDVSISQQALTVFISQYLGVNDISIAEQYGILSAGFIQSLRIDNDSLKRDVYQLINVLCALCNTSDDTWICPGEEIEDNKNFVFVERS
jgi:hypothetical protein